MDCLAEMKAFCMRGRAAQARIREVLWLVPPSLKDPVQKFCSSLSYSASIASPLSTDDKTTRTDLEWTIFLNVIYTGQNDNLPELATSWCFFGGEVAIAANESLAFHRNSGGYWAWEARFIDQYFPLVMSRIYENTFEKFLASASPILERIDGDILNFMLNETNKLGEDAVFLFKKVLSLKTLEQIALRGQNHYKNYLVDLKIRIAKELGEIVKGIRGSQSFAKSKALRALRERGEKLLEDVSKVVT